MPSRVEPGGAGGGFGIAYVEAGAHGLPVVAGNVGGALDAVVDGETGLLVDPENPEAVAGRAGRAASGPRARQADGPRRLGTRAGRSRGRTRRPPSRTCSPR